MLSWITSNIGNIIVVVVLAVIVGAIIWRMIRNRKAGKSSCGCGCSTCSGCSSKSSNHKEAPL